MDLMLGSLAAFPRAVENRSFVEGSLAAFFRAARAAVPCSLSPKDDSSDQTHWFMSNKTIVPNWCAVMVSNRLSWCQTMKGQKNAELKPYFEAVL